MSPEHFDRFIPAICAGFGLFLAGAVNLLLVRRGLLVRSVATILALGLALGTAAALDQSGTAKAVAPTARLLAFGLLPFLLLGSRRVAGAVAGLAAGLQRPLVRFGLLAAVGVGTVIGSVVVYEKAEEDANQLAMSELEMLQGQVPTVPAEQVKATTDRGKQVALREPAPDVNRSGLSAAEERFLRNSPFDSQVIRRTPADDRSNCHGWVFTGGRFRVSGEDVEVILKENGYYEHNEPQPGDLIVYRQGGAISHTAVVQYVTEGKPVLAESKWGNLGVFFHPANKSPYGTDYAFYRSARQGHLLAGVGGPVKVTEGQVPVVEE
jgi:hypothetical protein